MKPFLNLPSHFDRLPIDLFIPVIFLSFNTQDPVLKLARTEQLRLVNRAWQTAIDATAPFWTCIPNEPRSTLENVRRWIKNAGELPLHIMCNYQFIPSGGFMQLVTLLAHRWRKVELDAGYCSISTYIEKPVPLLEVFDLSSAFISPELIFFGGVHPVLSNVRLSDVVLPNDTGFLRNLKVLCLKLISGPSGKLRLSGLRAILAESPYLEQVVLDAHYLTDMQPPPPILLPYLTSFRLTASVHPPRCPAAVSTMIHAPNVTHLDLCFDGTPVPADLDLSSTLKVERLRQPSNLAIEISPQGFNLSTDIQSEAPCASPGVKSRG